MPRAHAPSRPPAPAGPVRPLVVTADERLLDDLLRLAAAAGVDVDVADDAGSALACWAAAPLVLVGTDLVGPLCGAAPPRRRAVALVGADLDDASVWQRAVELGAEHVLFLPDAEPWLVERLADAAEGPEGESVVVGVVGGRGGAGASVLATALALTSGRRGSPTTLVDADPLGGGLDLVLGAEDCHGLRWQDLAHTRGRVAGTALREALPHVSGLTLLAWDRGEGLTLPAEAARTVLEAVRRTSELVVVDLPRRLDPAVEELLSLCTTTLLVVPAEIRAVAAAGRVAAGLGLMTSDLRLVVRGPSPGGLGPDEVARVLGVPLAAHLRPEPGLTEALEQGRPPGGSGRGPLAGVCGDLLDQLVTARGAA
ncbi:MAG TPA: septum site-determining protein Ssd [Jiangellales bacterium]|nr:septum site-determining protein Ssd [Jiangellales bacterium]